MSSTKILAENHSLLQGVIFRLKSFVFIIKRGSQNLFSEVRKFSDTDELINETIIAVSESDLWNIDDNESNWILTAGKVQNLRSAAKMLNGIEIPANNIFSFWKYIGNPNIGKQFVIGREIREGCIIPTVAGGLCQLSNALYDAALNAHFEIIERHKHTQIIKGSLAEKNRDATVKWNYIDLRFRSAYSFRIEIDITPDKLIVKFKSVNKNKDPNINNPKPVFQPSKLNDCYSCGNLTCFKNTAITPINKKKAITTFIVDEKWPELDAYITTVASVNDFFIIPFRQNRFNRLARYNWKTKNASNTIHLSFAALQRILYIRILSKSKKNVFSLLLRFDKLMAQAAAKKIPVETTHLVISQNLLPFLWDEGVFGGRTFDVFMTRLPIQKLHDRLDLACKIFPESETLNDFRAPQQLLDLESSALTKSSQIITPHQDIADIFNNKSIKLEWVLPKANLIKKSTNNKILFPASAVGRKGAYEIKRLAIELNLTIVVAGKSIVYPTYIEHQPRLLLKASRRACYG